jgi:hypothetical protein
MFLFSNACLVSEISAQSAGSATPGSPLSNAAPSIFLVAPSFPLGYAPSSVAAGNLTQSGKLDLVTVDYSSGNVTVFLGTGQGSFAPGVAYPAGAHPSSVLVVDINGDGRLDVLVSNETDGTISVLLGNGDGTLQPRKSYAVGFNPSFIATGDFNGNGKVDVAVAGKSASLLAILLNDGNGNLNKPILYTFPKTPTALTAADFNNDGHSDLAVANADGSVSILLGKGAGMFGPLPDISVASGSLSSIVFGDFNKDGKIDLAVTQRAQKLVSVLIGNGDGTFASPASYPVGSEPISTVVADLNSDGISDLIVINKSSNTFSVLNGNGDGTFKSAVDFVAGNAPLAAVAGDFYGNGQVALAIINHSSQSVSVPLGNGNGTFKAARSYPSGQKPVSIASGYLSGNKLPGLVVANYCGSDPSCNKAGSIAVFIADSTGAYKLSATYPVGAGPVSVSLADVNGDGYADIIALNRLDKTVSVLLGVGDGTFGQQITSALNGAPVTGAVGDFNKDGKPDLAVAEDCGAGTCSQPGSVEILVGAGDGTFQSAANYAAGYAPDSVAVGDVNGDKNPDIIVANRCGKDASCQSPGTGTVLLGDGTGKFTAGTDAAVGNSPSSIALGSLTGSGDLDLVVARSTDDTVAVLLGNGDGSFKAPVTYAVGVAPASLVVADFNGDGKPDVAVANLNDSTVSILFGNGDGTLQSATALPVGTGPAALAAVGRPGARHASLATANGNGGLNTAVSSTALAGSGSSSNSANGNASVATALGSSGSTTLGTEISVLPNAGSDPPLVSFALASSPTTSSVNESVTLTATLTGNAGTPPLATTSAASSTVTFFSNGTAISDCGTAGTAPVVVVDTPTGVSTSSCTTSTLTGGTDALTASYGGDGFYGADPPNGSGGSASQTVAQFAPGVTVTGSGSSVYGVATIFTAFVTGTPGPLAPTGTVNFFADGSATPLTCINSPSTLTATGPLTGTSTATCTIASLTGGTTHQITATYVPGTDPNYLAVGPSAPFPQTVSPATPTIVVTGAGSSVYGTSTTFTATISGVTGLASPTGTVNFYASDISPTIPLTCSNPAGQTVTATTPGVGTATCDIASIIGGAHQITALYNPPLPATNYNSALPASVLPFQVTPFTPGIAVTLTAGTNPSTYGGSLTFTATVTGVTTQASPTGTISFADGVTPLTCIPSPPALLPTTPGVSATTCTIASLTGGTHSINATYAPGSDPNYAAAGPSAGLPQTVNKLATTLAILPSAAPSNVNDTVIFTATVSYATPPVPASPPSGTVSFTLNSVAFANCQNVAINGSGKWTCNIQTMVAPSDTIGATYNGDLNYVGSTAPNLPQTVNPLTPTFTVSTLTPSVPVGTPVTFLASLTGVLLSPVNPRGTVSFTANGTSIPTCSGLSVNGGAGAATCIASGLVAPTDAILATYSPDPNFTVSAPASFIETVTKATAAVTMSSSPASPVVNQSTTLTALVLAQGGPGAPVQPGGTVTFTQGATTLCSGAGINSTTHIATCIYAFSSASSSTITATYGGDLNFVAGTQGTLPETVLASATTTSVVSTPNPSAVNQQVTFTATVKPAFTAGTALPAGSVVISTIPATTTCTAQVVAGIVQACNLTFTANGSYTVIATYNGDPNFLSSVSPSTGAGTDVQAVGVAPTTVNLTQSPNPSFVDQSATLSATIGFNTSGSAQPTGTVKFYDGGNLLPSCTATGTVSLPFTGGVVPPCTVPFLTQGTHSLTAIYSGDLNFGGSTSSAQNQIVNSTATVTSVVSSPNPSAVNAQVTATATVTPAYTAGGTKPAGTVTITTTPATTTCTQTLVAGAVPACTFTFTSNGSYTIVATYNTSDANFLSSTSPSTGAGADVQTVGKEATSVVLTSSPNPSSVNQQVAVAATISFVAATGTPQPTGTVTYSDGARTLCTFTGNTTAPFTGGVIPACTAALFTAGHHAITASYSGDANFSGSALTLNPTQQVNLAATATTVMGSSSSAPLNTSVTFTATVTPSPAPSTGSVNPTGTVTFQYVGTNGTLPATPVTLCAAAGVTPTGLGLATATCSSALPAVGTYTITAAYDGDANFNATTSAGTFSFAVGTTTTTLALSSSSPVANALSTSVASQLVTFTATVTPTYAGTPVTGVVQFISSDTPSTIANTLSGCGTAGAVPLSPAHNGSATAVCTVQFPVTEAVTTGALSGQVNVTATFVPPPPPAVQNFSGSTNSIVQVVQNYGIAFSAPASDTVLLTQGYANSSSSSGSPVDPFNPAPITVTVTSSGGFSDQLSLNCAVTAKSVTGLSAGQTVTDPSCVASSPTISGVTGSAVSYTLSASSAALAGSYAVTITADDKNTSATIPYSISQSTVTPLVVYVVSQSGTLTLAQGAIGVENTVFNTAAAPSPDTLATFACGNVQLLVNGLPSGSPFASTGITCKGPSTTVTGAATTVPITISNLTTAAQLDRNETTALAAFLGVPLFALLGWFTTRKSPRKSCFRFFGLILLLVGVSYATGCGGSFTKTGGTTNNGGLPVGSYLVQVIATDSNGVQYYAVVPLTVNPNQ